MDLRFLVTRVTPIIPTAARASRAMTPMLEALPVCGLGDAVLVSVPRGFTVFRIGDGAALFDQGIVSGRFRVDGIVAVLYHTLYQDLVCIRHTVYRYIRGIITRCDREADAHRTVGGYFLAFCIEELDIIEFKFLAHIAEGSNGAVIVRPLRDFRNDNLYALRKYALSAWTLTPVASSV